MKQRKIDPRAAAVIARYRETSSSPTPCRNTNGNGNQDLVLAAVRQGLSDRRAIETWTGLDRDQVGTSLRRLIDAGSVRRKLAGGYAPAEEVCLLAEVWR